jgi:hypothetical protein
MSAGLTCDWSRRMLRLAIFLSAGLLWAAPSFPQNSPPPRADTQSQQGSTDRSDKTESKSDKSAEPAMTKLRIHISTDTDKPVANASVYVRFYTSGGFLHHDKLAEMNFKTNQDGSVKVPEIPQGKIMIQVIATGWHTYGKWYDVEKEEESIDIKLAPPTHWY